MAAGRLTIPSISSLDNGVGGEVTADQSSDITDHSSNNNSTTTISKDALEQQQTSSQECSGGFQDVYHSTAVTVCSTAAISNNNNKTMPVATIANGPNPITMTTTEESAAATYTITSSFESSHHDKVTFAVPVLQSSSTTSSSVTTLTSPYDKPSNVLDQSNATNSSFYGTFSNNTSFDHSATTGPAGFSNENSLIVPEGTISCQLASQLTNQPLDNSISKDISSNSTAAVNGGRKKYICEHDGCTKTYRYKKDVIRHMKMKHGTQPTRYELKEVTEMLLRKHGCSQCDKMYAHRKDLLRHQRDVHSPEAMARREAAKNNQKKYPCDQPNCNKFYVHKKDLIRHRRNDHNDFTDTKDMHIPDPVSPSQYSSTPAKRQRTNWSSSKVVSGKVETASEPMTASDMQQWLGVTVVKEGNVNAAAAMATSDSGNTGTLASNCALFNTSPSASNAASSLLSLLNSASQQPLAVDNAAAQLIGQTSVHPLFSAVTSNAQGTAPTPTVSNAQN